MDNQRIVLNVSGLIFETYLSTLNRFPDTLLGNPEQRIKFYDYERNEYFFDRSRSCFEHILYYYQSGGVIRKPKYVDIDIFVDEIKFFKLDSKLVFHFSDSEMFSEESTPQMPSNLIRRKLWQFFEYPESSIYAKIFAGFSISVILLSICLYCIETLPHYSVQIDGNNHTDSIIETFFYIETSCVTWFIIELLIRFLLCPVKCQFIKGFLNIVDLISIIPYFISLGNKYANGSPTNSFQSIRTVKLVRVFRIFKLTRHSQGLQILGQTLRASIQELMMLLFFLGILVVTFSSAIYFAEATVPNSPFRSIPDGFWWAIVTITTVGYGDVYPIGIPGKIICSFCAVAGVLTIALPVPVIVSNFDYYYRLDMERRNVQTNPNNFHSYGRVLTDYRGLPNCNRSLLIRRLDSRNNVRLCGNSVGGEYSSINFRQYMLRHENTERPHLSENSQLRHLRHRGINHLSFDGAEDYGLVGNGKRSESLPGDKHSVANCVDIGHGYYVPVPTRMCH
ncbi:potassium voltage-gated channel subfamily A member 7-like [Octopus sinensis]|uniref:Potassium voltage-gated channel subfamily A member 7-like n=1 Tax=Octopus sinensis TaxID=2607531 RepID=A0A6P7TQ76_9MOLL|nr:potassium voltage-gated channel subfamily A member 7-like [Octopus sinensis]